ncbi:MAG: GNAT family N-acetyltransferase [Chitinophagaceae bacterium]|nr:GNAT family N-acetyltransferase [Chitinophagaceae bacterium]
MIRKTGAADHQRLIEIWESAVLHTHDFLNAEDFLYYKTRMPVYFEHVTLLGYEADGVLAGFMGISGPNLEMLFIHNDFRGRGIGKKLLTYGIEYFKVSRVDVNEQNIQALGFYRHMGFDVLERTALDGEGKAYPILKMRL